MLGESFSGLEMKDVLLTILFVALQVTAGSAAEECRIEEMVSQKDFFSRVFIQQGKKLGQIHYEFDPVHADITPEGFTVGVDGRLWVLEGTRLKRIQGFESDGSFIVALAAAALVPPATSIVTVATPSRNVIATLTGDPPTPGTPGGPYLRTFEVDTRRPLQRVPLNIEALAGGGIERAAIDASGFVWVFTDRWLVFKPDGNLLTRLGNRGEFVDRSGRLYISNESLEVIDREGRQVAKLAFPSGEEITIAGGSLETVLFAWDRKAEEKKTGGAVDAPNILRLFRVDRNKGMLVQVDRLVLQTSRYRYPNPHLDFVVPEHVYIRELTFFREGVFWFFAYSDSQYWIDRFDWSAWDAAGRP